MSRTQPNGTTSSPVKKYLSFKGSTGQIHYYDKDSDQEDKNVFLNSLDFIVLDVKASISGFNENESCGISSNLLDQFDLGKKELTVKTKVNGQFGVFAKGLYRDIKDKAFSIGGKFTTNIFALADVGSGMEIVRIELSGASLGPWIDFSGNLDAGQDIYGLKITLGKGILCGRKDGKNHEVSKDEYNKVLVKLKKNPMAPKPVWFYTSAFSGEEISGEYSDLADDGDKVLQEYFKDASPSVKPEDIEAEYVTVDPTLGGDEPDLPF